MPRTTIDATLERRANVEKLDVHGASASAIARTLGADRRTIYRDLTWLRAERARELDVAGTRLRLLEAAQLVERTAWELYTKLPEQDANGRLGCLGKVLAAHQALTALLGAIEAATLAEEVSDLRTQIAHLRAEQAGPRAMGR